MTICNQFRIRRMAHATTSSTRPFHSPYTISYRYSIATKSVSPAVFEIMGIKHNGVTTLAFLGNVTSSVTWPFDSPCPIYDRCSIAEKSVSPAVLRYWAQNIFRSRPWPSGSCDIIPGRHFYRCSIVTKYVSPLISEILGPKHIVFTPLNSLGHVTSSVTGPFHSQVAISYRCSIVTKSLSTAVFEIMGIKHNGVTTLTFLGHVTSSVTWQLDSGWVISYWWSFGPKSLSLTVSEIFRPKHHLLIDTMLYRHWACAISRDMYPLCKI